MTIGEGKIFRITRQKLGVGKGEFGNLLYRDLFNFLTFIFLATKAMDFQRRVGTLFGDIDEIAYHPLVSLLRSRTATNNRGGGGMYIRHVNVISTFKISFF